VFVKLVYVCSLVRGDIKENLKKANRYCAYVVGCGHIPISDGGRDEAELDDALDEDVEQ
jgi:hypothetical protein